MYLATIMIINYLFVIISLYYELRFCTTTKRNTKIVTKLSIIIYILYIQVYVYMQLSMLLFTT